MKKWVELYLKNEDKIKEKLGELFKIAYEIPFGIATLILYEDGNLDIEISESDNTVDDAVKEEKAIYIESFDAKYFDITESNKKRSEY